MSETVCIHHGNCADGFSAAWVVRKAASLLGRDVQYVPGFYGNKTIPDVVNKEVLMVDFTYPRAVLEDVVAKAKSVTVLDHHLSAQADLEGVKGLTSVFDMNRAGCRITWDYFFPDEAPPPLLLHIEDRDLWRFALRKTREIQASVFAYEYKFDVWDYLMSADLDKLAQEGEAIERKHFKDIRELLPVVQRRMVIDGHEIPVANLPYTMGSDAGMMMAKGQKFAACYYDKEGSRVFSLRSHEDGMDVSKIAFKFGGGGHRGAAGFVVPIGHELARA